MSERGRPKVAVVGTGLVGGSILLRLHAVGFDAHGWDPDPRTREYGRSRGLHCPEDLAAAVADREVVFLASPLAQLPEVLRTVGELVPGHCLLTDVGSVKDPIARYASRTALGGRFIPGHPMAGAEHAGLTAASADLFAGAAWVLCPAPGRPLHPFRQLTALLTDVFGARVVPLPAAAHDTAVALSSHVPHLLASALASAADRSAQRSAVLALAAGSFRDGTRVAGTPTVRTAAMLLANREAVRAQLARVGDLLSEWDAALSASDAGALAGLLSEGARLRADLLDRPTVTGARSFAVPAAEDAELDFLMRLGTAGGWVTGCTSGPAAVTYLLQSPLPLQEEVRDDERHRDVLVRRRR